jgi:hypothetical protein
MDTPRQYQTNYWLLAAAWLFAFVVLAFVFRICGEKGLRHETVAVAIKNVIAGHGDDFHYVGRIGLILGCIINAIAAGLLCWPLQGIANVALTRFRRIQNSQN